MRGAIMLIREILQAHREAVLTVSADDLILAAARLLAPRHVGILVVLGDNRRVEGVLSERDIVRGVATAHEELHEMKVRELMTRDFAFCGLGDTAEAAMGVMSQRQVRHLPVIEGGVLQGLISIADVLKNRFDACEIDSRALRDYVGGVGYH